MKLTTQRLKQLIKEEIQATLREGKDEVLKTIEKIEDGYMGSGLRFTALKKFVSAGDKEAALKEVNGMTWDSETQHDDQILEELLKLIQEKM